MSCANWAGRTVAVRYATHSPPVYTSHPATHDGSHARTHTHAHKTVCEMADPRYVDWTQIQQKKVTAGNLEQENSFFPENEGVGFRARFPPGSSSLLESRPWWSASPVEPPPMRSKLIKFLHWDTLNGSLLK